MFTKFLLLRHGQSIANTEKFFSGQIDVELTELGFKQAQFASESLKNEKIDIVYSSPLSRAIKTAEPFAQLRRLGVLTNDAFTEWNAGDWQGLSFEKIREKYPHEYYCWKNKLSALHMPNGESASQVRLRFGKALDALSKEIAGKTALIVCHGGVITTLPSYFAELDDSVLDKTTVPGNCSVTEVIYENGIGRITRYSDESHLGSCKSEAFII